MTDPTDIAWKASLHDLRDGETVTHQDLLIQARRDGGLVRVIHTPSNKPVTPPVEAAEVAEITKDQWALLSRGWMAAYALFREKPTSIHKAVEWAYMIRPGNDLLEVAAQVRGALEAISIHWVDRGVRVSLTHTGIEIHNGDLKAQASYGDPDGVMEASVLLGWWLR